jgi:hypothetical protein
MNENTGGGGNFKVKYPAGEGESQNSGAFFRIEFLQNSISALYFKEASPEILPKILYTFLIHAE